jgi:hypothetical protein
MTLKEGIYEVYLSLSAIGAVTAFKEKYGYLPDDVQRQGDVVLAGPVKPIGYHGVEQFYKNNDEEDE